jgi:flagellar biosynthesis chaperone FliJ
VSAYPLEALLELRTRAEDDAKAALERARSQVDEATRAHAARVGELAAAREGRARAEAGIGGASAAALQAAAAHAARLREREATAVTRLGAAEAARAAAEGTAREREATLFVARRDRRAIALHRERWESARRRARASAEDAAQDDVASAVAARGQGRDEA